MKIPGTLRWKPTGRTLGQGGQASVQEVRDGEGEFAGSFALKALSPTKPRKAYERFSREVQAIKSLCHPSIIRVVDHSEPDADFQFYVMELHEGATPLERLLGTDQNPFWNDPRKALSLFMHLVSGIQACEERGIVHRDLSPANVLVLPDGSIKIIDFGICQIEEAGTITLTDEGVGTPNYMAPECESGAGGNIGPTADLYSAGKILWSAIANLRAFGREEPVFGPKSMNVVFPDDPLTWHLRHVFEKTIRHRAEDRWPSASDAIKGAKHVQFLVTAGYPPLELLNERCPICGVGRLEGFQHSHMVFGNPNPSGIRSVQCDYCGFCFARDYRKIEQDEKRSRELR